MRPGLTTVVIFGILVGGIATIVLTGAVPQEPSSDSSAEIPISPFAKRVGRSYRAPRPGDARQVADAFQAVVTGDERRADQLASEVRYLVTDRGAATVLEPAADARGRGWGVFAHATGRGNDGLIIEVPHPADDLQTADLGARLFSATHAYALLIAGSSRREVDVAHDASSPFAVVSARLARARAVHVQLHGFDERRHRVGDVVVSSGVPTPDPAAMRVAAAFRSAGHDVCLYTGGRCSALAGTTNVQQKAAHAAGAQFVHVELAQTLRTSVEARTRAVRLLAGAL